MDRKVTSTGKDDDKDITKLCGPWGNRSKQDAILDIEGRIHRYFVIVDGSEVDVNVINGPTGKYLRTDPDQTKENNLDELPNC